MIRKGRNYGGVNTSTDKIPDQLLAAKESAVAQFLTPEPASALVAFAVRRDTHANVVGVGIGRKLKDGSRSGKNSIRFYVKRKLPKHALSKDAVLPASIKGVQQM
jgi:hypothetical protein